MGDFLAGELIAAATELVEAEGIDFVLETGWFADPRVVGSVDLVLVAAVLLIAVGLVAVVSKPIGFAYGRPVN